MYEVAERMYEEWVESIRGSDRKLYVALRDAGLEDLANRASTGEWNDYFGKHGMNIDHLCAELGIAMHTIAREAFASSEPVGTQYRERIAQLNAVVVRAQEGDFDATREESDEWARSPEGSEVLAGLVRERKS